MKKIKIFLLFLVSCTAFSQNKKFDYYFDHYEVQVIKNYGFENGFPEKKIIFSNSKDSNYILHIKTNKNSKEARLYDFNKKNVIEFSINTITFKVDDLGNLQLPKWIDFYFHNHEEKIDEENVEKMEYERDTILNKTVVHLIKFKNKKLKKIIHEDYFIFQKKQNSEFKKINEDVKKIIDKYNFNFEKGESLIKTLCLTDGKISLDIEYLENKNIDYNFTFNMND